MTDHCESHEFHRHGHCNCGCGDNCGCGSHHHHHQGEEGCHCAEKFLELADEAWKEVLKDKLKEKILNQTNEHMEKLADIIAKANGDRWKTKIAGKTKCHQFKESLKDFFSHYD